MPRATRQLLIFVCLLGVAVSVPRAAQLVFLHNGRVLQAEKVELSDGWYKLTLGKRSSIVIAARLIDEVVEVVDESGSRTLPNVQTSAGGSGNAVPVNRTARPSVTPPVRAVPAGTRPSGSAVSGSGTSPQLTQDARARAEALAARGRTLGTDLAGRRNPSAQPGSADQNVQGPSGTDVTGGSAAWPSLLDKDGKSRPRGSRREPPGDDNR